MKTQTITSKEYAKLYGCSHRFINFQLSNEKEMPGIISFRKSGGTWLIDVLRSWVDDKNGKV